MGSYHYCVIVGNVGKDPEKRYTQSGVPVTSFTVAVNERWNSNGEQREKTYWYRVSAWRALADVCEQYVHKGMQILVSGTVEASAFMGQDGQPRASLELTARDIQFLGSRGDGEGSSSYNDGGNYDDNVPESVDDIPF